MITMISSNFRTHDYFLDKKIYTQKYTDLKFSEGPVETQRANWSKKDPGRERQKKFLMPCCLVGLARKEVSTFAAPRQGGLARANHEERKQKKIQHTDLSAAQVVGTLGRRKGAEDKSDQ
jgi:hypothetical protein